MGLLDGLLGKVTGGSGGGIESQLMSAVAGLLTDKNSGGLAGLVEGFTKSGLGDVVSSWVGTGKNLPVSADQIVKGLGAQKIGSLATSLGIPSDQVSSMLSQLLPGMVDRLTPEGKVPERDTVEQGLGSLLKGLGI